MTVQKVIDILSTVGNKQLEVYISHPDAGGECDIQKVVGQIKVLDSADDPDSSVVLC